MTSVTDLAQRMGVGRHLIYDFERPRAGADQRQFMWRDIVHLCIGLDVTLPELVLPPEGKDGATIEDFDPRIHIVVGSYTDSGRNQLGLVLLGLNPDSYPT